MDHACAAVEPLPGKPAARLLLFGISHAVLSHVQSLASAPREPPDLIFTKTIISQKAAKIKGFLHLSALLVNGEQIFLLFTYWPKLQIPANIFFTYPIGRLLFPQHCGRVH